MSKPRKYPPTWWWLAFIVLPLLTGLASALTTYYWK